MNAPLLPKSPALPKSLADNPVPARWLSFETPGRVKARSGKVELGQGILTALSQIVADGLCLNPSIIEMAQADTALSPNEGFTAGSQSIEMSGTALRAVTAVARHRLLAAMADESLTGTFTLHQGTILRDGIATGVDIWTIANRVDWTRPIDAGEMAAAAGAAEGGAAASVGRSLPRIDLWQRVLTGGYIHDLALPGMLHARVLRQPWRLAHLLAVDRDWLARRHPRVEILHQADFLALLAADELAVTKAAAEAERFVTWGDGPVTWQPPEAPAERQVFSRTGTSQPPDRPNTIVRARYGRGHIAHASIGPSCAMAEYRAGQLTVWTHSQGIFPLRDQIARVLDLPKEKVRLTHQPGAGCYGHNGADDAALDAAIIAMARPDTPIRVMWSRTDELSRGPVGAAMEAEIEASLGDDGRIAQWTVTVESPPHAQRPGSGGYVNLTSAEALDPGFLPRHVEDLPDAAGSGAARNAVAIYDLPHHDVRLRLEPGTAVRTSSLRSLGAHLNVFAIEQAMDELADLAGADPLAFRLDHLTDPRCRAVLEDVAQLAGWTGPSDVGMGSARGLGVARYKNKGAWLAAVAEVSVEDSVTVSRLWLSVDAGRIVNPAGALAQIEGGAIQAVSWTLKEEVPVNDGRIPPLDWDAYPILRFSEVPEIITRFIAPDGAPSLGAGEPAQGPVAAAIGNAVARALGTRIRSMPFTRERIMQALLEG